MFHKVESKKVEEGQFYIARQLTQFSIVKFALITGFSFVETPSEADIEEHFSDEHLINYYFIDARKITFGVLENRFEECEDPDDSFKLGVCYLVEGVLNAPEKAVVIWQDMLKFVIDLDFFFSSIHREDFRTRSW